jgi:quercetin dioxygenase-like cupin family protein
MGLPPSPDGRGAMSDLGIRVVRTGVDGIALPLVEGPGRMDALVWTGMGAVHRAMHRVALEPGGRTVRLHHRRSEAVYFVVRGTGLAVEDGRTITHPLRAGMMFHVAPETAYRIQTATGPLVCVGGPCPPDQEMYAGITARRRPEWHEGDPRSEPVRGGAEPSRGNGIRVFDVDRDGVAMPLISRDARMVVWPGVGARTASMNYVILEPEEANKPHQHPLSEDTIYVLEGEGAVENQTLGKTHPIEAECVLHVPPTVVHAVRAHTRMVSVGGPCPPDLDFLRACGVRWDDP